jgi:hypothetical protein
MSLQMYHSQSTVLSMHTSFRETRTETKVTGSSLVRNVKKKVHSITGHEVSGGSRDIVLLFL